MDIDAIVTRITRIYHAFETKESVLNFVETLIKPVAEEDKQFHRETILLALYEKRESIRVRNRGRAQLIPPIETFDTVINSFITYNLNDEIFKMKIRIKQKEVSFENIQEHPVGQMEFYRSIEELHTKEIPESFKDLLSMQVHVKIEEKEKIMTMKKYLETDIPSFKLHIYTIASLPENLPPLGIYCITKNSRGHSIVKNKTQIPKETTHFAYNIRTNRSVEAIIGWAAASQRERFHSLENAFISDIYALENNQTLKNSFHIPEGVTHIRVLNEETATEYPINEIQDKPFPKRITLRFIKKLENQPVFKPISELFKTKFKENDKIIVKIHGGEIQKEYIIPLDSFKKYYGNVKQIAGWRLFTPEDKQSILDNVFSLWYINKNKKKRKIRLSHNALFLFLYLLNKKEDEIALPEEICTRLIGEITYNKSITVSKTININRANGLHFRKHNANLFSLEIIYGTNAEHHQFHQIEVPSHLLDSFNALQGMRIE